MAGEMRLRRQVQFSETDTAGIVHFSNFFRYFEDAEHALWREAGLSIHPEKSAIGWPRVAAACEYHRALKFEEEFDIVVRIKEIARRTIEYVGKITRNGELIASGTWTIACAVKRENGTMKSAEIPADVAERLKPYLFPTSDLRPPTSV